jgi:hypothetical protein
MLTKVLNRRQAHWAELFAGYDFILVHFPGIKNPTDGPSRHLDYVQDVSIPTGFLLPPCSLWLMPLVLLPSPTSQFISNTLFANVVGVHATVAIESGLYDQILQRLPSDIGVQ